MSEQVSATVQRLIKSGDAAAADMINTLHAEAEALRAENEEWAPTMQRLGDQNQALRAELEAARGLLAQLRGMINCTVENDSDRMPVWISTKHPVIERIDAFLAATPAPEVRCQVCNDTACDPSHEELVPCPGCAAQPAQVDNFHGNNAALVSSAKALLALDEKGALTGGGIGGHARAIIGAFIARLAEQGERQEAVAFRCKLSIHKDWKYIDHRAPDSFELRECEIQPLYTTPQPGPDVRGLVRAGQQMANSCYNLSQFEIIGDANVKAQLRDLAKGWDEALTAHRQAQRKGDSHDT